MKCQQIVVGFVISLKDLLSLRIVARNIVLNLSVEGVGIRDVGKKGEQSSEVGVGGYRGGIERWTSCGAGQRNATLLSHCDGHTGRKQCTCSRCGQLCCPSPCRCYALGSPSFTNPTLIPLDEAMHAVSLPTAQIGVASACIVLLLHAHMRAGIHPASPEIERLIVVYSGPCYRSLASLCFALWQQGGEAVADGARYSRDTKSH